MGIRTVTDAGTTDAGLGDTTILANASLGAQTIRLAAVADAEGKAIAVKKTDSGANAVAVLARAGETLEGGSVSLEARGQHVSVVCDGTKWIVADRSSSSAAVSRLVAADSAQLTAGAVIVRLKSVRLFRRFAGDEATIQASIEVVSGLGSLQLVVNGTLAQTKAAPFAAVENLRANVPASDDFIDVELRGESVVVGLVEIAII